MASRETIYLSNEGNVSEVERAVRLCLRADWAAVPETVVPESWQAWCNEGKWQTLARHVVTTYALAERLAAAEIIAADRSLAQGLLSLYAEADELPSTNDPLRKNLLRAVRDDKMPGYLATFCAVSARQAFLPLLVALQSAIFLEWRARQLRLPDVTVAQFLGETSDLFSKLRYFLSTHEKNSPSRFGNR
jgi:hypothetical protein